MSRDAISRFLRDAISPYLRDGTSRFLRDAISPFLLLLPFHTESLHPPKRKVLTSAPRPAFPPAEHPHEAILLELTVPVHTNAQHGATHKEDGGRDGGSRVAGAATAEAAEAEGSAAVDSEEAEAAAGQASTATSTATLLIRATWRPTLNDPEAKLPLDVYGFQVPLAHVLAFHRVRMATGRDGTMWLAQWNALMRRAGSNGPLPAEAGALASSRFGRVPLQHRPHLWMCLSGARELMLASSVTYWEHARLADSGEVPLDPALIKQIESDLPRTFPQHMGFATATGLRDALRRVLVAFSAYNVSVGYCQSLNFVAAVFLLVADEEGAFWLLVALCRTVVADYHTREMSGLRIDTGGTRRSDPALLACMRSPQRTSRVLSSTQPPSSRWCLRRSPRSTRTLSSSTCPSRSWRRSGGSASTPTCCPPPRSCGPGTSCSRVAGWTRSSRRPSRCFGAWKGVSRRPR